jgi:hypothetical protein
MTEWDTHGEYLGYNEVEDGRTANKNWEGAEDVLDKTDRESAAGGLHENVVPHFLRCYLGRVRSRDHERPPWVGKDQQR